MIIEVLQHLHLNHTVKWLKIPIFSLPKRVNNLDLPEIKIIDMKNENEIISKLEQRLEITLKKTPNTYFY